MIARFAPRVGRKCRAGTVDAGRLHISISPQQLAELVKVVEAGTITKQIAKDVFIEMFQL